MKTLLLSATFALTCAAAAPALDDHATWIADFDAAVAVAKDQGKDLFVDFTGSDWCGWCIRLHDEVFQHEEFLGPAQEKFVLVALDYPNGEEAKAKVPNPERNAELQQQYGIRGFPTCLLMNTDGVVFARMGYQEGGPEQYIADMTANTATGKQLLVDVAKLETAYAEAGDKTPVVRKAIAMLIDMNPESVGVTVVADMARQALKLDPENAAGTKLLAMQALMGAGQADAELLKAARAMDAHNELGLLEQVVQAQFGTVRDDTTALAATADIEALLELGKYHDAVEVKAMAITAARWCTGPLEDNERAVALATKANAIEAEVPEYMQDVLNEILE